MRVLTMVGVGLVCAAATLSGQHSDQIEIGSYGTFTRFDRMYGLPNRVGGGVHFGYFISDHVGVEADANWLGPSALAGRASYLFHNGSLNLVFNLPTGDRAMVYVLGGVSRIDYGTTIPYNYAENGVDGGGGLRLMVSDRVGLRFDGRVFYDWKKSQLTGHWTGHDILSAGLTYMTGLPRTGGYVARAGERDYLWYWGAQGGVILVKTNNQSTTAEPIVGGQWLITKHRSSLLFSYETSFFINDVKAIITDPASTTSSIGPGFRDVTFNRLRRISIGLVAHPAQRHIEPFVGGGFAIMQVTNPLVDCSTCKTNSEIFGAQDLADAAASKAFAWVLGGLQINLSRRLNVFGQYILTSAGSGFLLEGNTHSLMGGVRYSLGSAREDVIGPR
ncbi:MAG TPA: outer membrane beta-barrel protein [Gemmatimonadales bacterium]|nr:outer membrane beta-barrel protein [Gemmatimonadales bacterium]